MNGSCKGHCNLASFNEDYDTTRKNKNAWKSGYRRCRTCEYFIKGLNKCPCCGLRLATGPRNAKYKRLLKMDIGRY